MSLKFYASEGQKLLSALPALFTLSVWLFNIYIHRGEAFSLLPFLFSLFLMSIWVYCSFYFLRMLCNPVLQIDEESVVITSFVRREIPVSEVKELQIYPGRFEITYYFENKVEFLKVPIITTKKLVSIKEGKMEFKELLIEMEP